MQEEWKKLYSLLIVDDEPSMLQGLSRNIHWETVGFKIAALLNDGRSAIEYLGKHRVDVVLSDVKMQGASGIDVAAYIYHHFPETKIVLLSGYREFGDAQKALDYKVQCYITKPFRISELRKTMGDIARHLQEEETRQADRKSHEEEVRRWMRENLFVEAVIGALRSEYAFNRKIADADVYREYLGVPCAVARVRYQGDIHNMDKVLRRCMGEAFVCSAVADGDLCQLVFIKTAAFTLDEDRMRDRIESIVAEAEVKSITLYDDVKALALASRKKEPSRDEVSVPAGGTIGSVCRYVQEHYSEKITLASAAGYVHLNAAYLSRIFGEQTGYTFRDYLVHIRIRAAARMLIVTEHPVYKICDLVGYTDVKHFYAQFKKIMQSTPSEYRERAWKGRVSS